MRIPGLLVWILISTVLMTSILTAGCTYSGSIGPVTQKPTNVIPTSTLTPTTSPTPAIPGMKTYSNYSFSFNYPEGMAIVETGLTDNDKSALFNGGRVSVRNSSYDNAIIWAKTNGPPITHDEDRLLTSLKDFQNDPGFTDVAWGNIEQISHLGHTVSIAAMSYKKSNSNQQYSTQSALWYCPESDRSYFISIDTINDSTSAKNTMMTYLDSLQCH